MVDPFERGTVYAIRHNPTGRIYVGSTTNLNARLRSHMAALINGKHPVELMQRDYEHYGNDYSLFILYDTLLQKKYIKDCRMIERLFMTLLGTRDPEKGYNYRDGKDFSLDKLQEYKILYHSKDWMDPRYLKTSIRPYKYIQLDEEDGDEWGDLDS